LTNTKAVQWKNGQTGGGENSPRSPMAFTTNQLYTQRRGNERTHAHAQEREEGGGGFGEIQKIIAKKGRDERVEKGDKNNSPWHISYTLYPNPRRRKGD